MEKTFKFAFNENEINVIFSAIQEKPFKEVYNLVNKINAQIQEQINAEKVEATTDDGQKIEATVKDEPKKVEG